MTAQQRPPRRPQQAPQELTTGQALKTHIIPEGTKFLGAHQKSRMNQARNRKDGIYPSISAALEQVGTTYIS